MLQSTSASVGAGKLRAKRVANPASENGRFVIIIGRKVL
ncbi:hypothetical protein PJE062_3750 [Pseudovibrio sp. JE062]|nr:hypothetical protein PJE062_3750 [Pseudovibrio sp. JE062]